MIHFLYEALEEPIGLIIRSDEPTLLRQKLYAERKKDPRLRALRIVASPSDERELWIIKKRGIDGT